MFEYNSIAYSTDIKFRRVQFMVDLIFKNPFFFLSKCFTMLKFEYYNWREGMVAAHKLGVWYESQYLKGSYY